MIDILKVKVKSVKWLLLTGGLLYLILVLLLVFTIWDSANIFFLITQLVFVPFFSIVIMYMFHDLLGSTNSTFLLTYYKYRFIKIYLLTLCLYLIPLFILCIFMNIYFTGFSPIMATFLLFTQLLLISSISIIIFVITMDISIALSFLAIYISTELATFGDTKYVFHLFYMNLGEPIVFSNVWSMVFLNLLIGIVGYRLVKKVIS